MRGATLPSPWLAAVERVVRGIPRGRTASYGLVALLAGRPGGARAVVRALHALADVPWWRVVRSDGTLAPPVQREQAQRLAAEGVVLRAGRVPTTARMAPSASTEALPFHPPVPSSSARLRRRGPIAQR